MATNKAAGEFNDFNMYAGLLGAAADRIALRSAKRMRKRASDYAASHRDTGAETEGIYVKSWNGYNEGPKAIGKAEELNPRARMFDEVGEPERGVTLIVAETPYDAINEYGGHNHAAHPFMTPAFYDEMPNFWKDARNLERELKRGHP